MEKLKQKGLKMEKNYGKRKKKVTQPMRMYDYLLIDHDSDNSSVEESNIQQIEPPKKRVRFNTRPENDDSSGSENETNLNSHKHTNMDYTDDEEFEF